MSGISPWQLVLAMAVGVLCYIAAGANLLHGMCLLGAIWLSHILIRMDKDDE